MGRAFTFGRLHNPTFGTAVSFLIVKDGFDALRFVLFGLCDDTERTGSVVELAEMRLIAKGEHHFATGAGKWICIVMCKPGPQVILAKRC